MFSPAQISTDAVLDYINIKRNISDVPFYLTDNEALSLFSSTECDYYTKKPFDTIKDVSMERINPRIPYVKRNVVLIDKDLNQLKGATLDAFIHQSKLSNRELYNLFRELSLSFKHYAQKEEQELKKRIIPNFKKQGSKKEKLLNDFMLDSFKEALLMRGNNQYAAQ